MIALVRIKENEKFSLIHIPNNLEVEFKWLW